MGGEMIHIQMINLKQKFCDVVQSFTSHSKNETKHM